MNNKNNLALFAIFTLGLLNLFTINIFAQTTDLVKTEQSTKTASGGKFVMPESVSVDNEAFASFIKVMSLPSGNRQKMFSDISNQEKANVFKVQLALNFIKRPNLTKEQKDLILDSISMISADTYQKENLEKRAETLRGAEALHQKALALFPRNEANEIFGSMNGDKKDEILLLQKYEDLLKAEIGLRKKIVKEMPVTERVNIWKTQLVYHLATSSFNKEQKEFIVEFMPTIQSTFEASSNLSEEERAKYAEALESSMFKVFTKAEAYAVFMTIGIQKRVVDGYPK